MRGGLSLKDFLLALLQSDEFARKYSVNNLDNTDFVTLTYRLLLGRDPDGAGFENYVSKLSAGELSRPRIYEDILVSDEFHTRHAALFTAVKPRTRAGLE